MLNLDISNKATVDLIPGKIGGFSRSCGEVFFVGEAGLTMRERNGILCVEGRKKWMEVGWRLGVPKLLFGEKEGLAGMYHRYGGKDRCVKKAWNGTGQLFIILWYLKGLPVCIMMHWQRLAVLLCFVESCNSYSWSFSLLLRPSSAIRTLEDINIYSAGPY